MPGPPPPLVDSLVAGPSILTAFDWHEEIDSTMRRAAELAAGGAAEGSVVAADVQTAGRGRAGRAWTAPAGTSLMLSIVLRPPVEHASLPLLPLVAGLALAEAVAPHVPGVTIALKWPNDLLAGGEKAAGILAESAASGAAIVGIGLNVDWRGVERPPDLAGATSLAEASGRPVDRWRLLAGLAGVLGNRYAAWCRAPTAFLDDYRARCATLGQAVRVLLPGGRAIVGRAEAVTGRGGLRVRDAGGAAHDVHAGDVVHVRSP